MEDKIKTRDTRIRWAMEQAGVEKYQILILEHSQESIKGSWIKHNADGQFLGHSSIFGCIMTCNLLRNICEQNPDQEESIMEAFNKAMLEEREEQ